MFSKNVRGYKEDEVPSPKRLKANVGDLFLSGDISAKRCKSLFNDADGVKAKTKSGNKNAHRDLLRKFAKSSKWPLSYEADIRVLNHRTQEVETNRLPILLPHEIIAEVCNISSVSAMVETVGMEPSTLTHFQAAAKELNEDASSLLGLGMWLDGVPCNWDRSQSVEVIALNFPGLPGENGDVRIPIAIVPKKFVAKHKTHDDILAVVAWSFKHLAMGLHPTSRHDAQPWGALDKSRKKNSGKQLPVRGALAEVRGDWAMFSDP